ncbi:hypothetical protein [Desulfovibrio sp.]
MEFSPNRYSLSVDVDSESYGPASARKQTGEEAREFCRSKGQALSVGNVDLHSSTYATAAIVFRCVEPQFPGPAGHACDFCGIGLASETVPRPLPDAPVPLPPCPLPRGVGKLSGRGRKPCRRPGDA